MPHTEPRQHHHHHQQPPDVHADLAREVTQHVHELEASTAAAETLVRTKAGQATRAELEAMRERLNSQASTLMIGIGQLPSGHAAQARAFRAVEASEPIRERIDMLLRADAARVATTPDAAHGDRHDLIDQAKDVAPPGFCDVAPQNQTPCELDPATRQRYRDRVSSTVSKAETNWLAAISSLKIAEQIKKKDIPFEQTLANLLMDTLFGIVTGAAKGLAHKAVDGGAKRMGTELEVYATSVRVDGPSSSAIGAAKQASDWAIKTGSAAGRSGIKSLGQVDAEARSGVPADEMAFLDTLKNLPSKWSSAILANLEYLLDADLAALVVGLPPLDKLNSSNFEQHIQDVVRRFREQVLVVAPWVRPITVMTKGRTRHALITAATKQADDLHGEWAGATVQSGKWDLVRWIDDDMIGMARGRTKDFNPDAFPSVASAFDGSFWSTESLHAIAEELAAGVP